HPEQRPATSPLGLCPLHLAGPAQVKVAGPSGPDTMIVLAQRAQAVIAKAGPRIQHHLDLRRVVTRHDLAEHYRAIYRAGEGERLAAFGNAILGDPAAPPDQAPLLVVAAPDELTHRRDGVHASAADERGEHRAGVPARCAHPDHVAARADERAALTIGDQRVIPQ